MVYRICINIRNLYDSNEASQDDVEGILIEERRVGLGWVGYGSFSMAKTLTGVSNRHLVGEADALRGLNINTFCNGGLECRHCCSGGFKKFLQVRLHVHDRWQSDH